MKEVIKNFVRYPKGGWLCVSDVEFDGPFGHVRTTVGSVFMPGTCFRGTDVAQLLDAMREPHGRTPSAIERT
jgi:hypothetical protein